MTENPPRDAAPAAGADARVTAPDGSTCSLWWTHAPVLPGARLGSIGEIAVTDPGTRLVHAALERLRDAGCTLAVAPMDGNTWRSYRFVTGSSGDPPFWLEPVNPAGCPGMFQEAGFAPLARYSSSRVDLGAVGGSTTEGAFARIGERLARRGVTIRQLDPRDFQGELDRLHALSLAAFADNFLYAPISREEFGQLYDGIGSVLVPEYVRFAEVEGNPVSFVFAIPDFLEQRRTGRLTTLIVKTLATHPRWRHLGIGSVLVDQVQAAARARGFTAAIHALQHESNTSLKITGRNQGRRIRDYTLFARPLP